MLDVKELILDNFKEPIVYMDMDHIVAYMNKSALKVFKEGERLVGRSIFDSYDEEVGRTIIDVFEKLKYGLTEEAIPLNEKKRMFMRVVRGDENQMIGYYLRLDPFIKK